MMVEQQGLIEQGSTAPGRRLAALFNIHPGEGRPVVSLVLLYCFLGFTIVFTQTAAFALFVGNFGVQRLPYVYMAIAGVVSLVAYVYLKLARHLALSRLLVVNLTFLLLGSIVFRAALALENARWLSFALPIWFQALVNLAQIAFWTLAGTLFDLRQAKRLFGLVGSGYWLAYIIGGILTPALIAGVGTANLLLLAAGSVTVALGFLLSILRSYQGRLAPPADSAPARGQQSASGLLRNRYGVLIFAMTILWWVGFFFIDNIFYDRVTARYASADQLAGFLGSLFAAVGILGLLTSVFLTGSIIGRYGLRAARLSMPILLTVGIGALALSGTLVGATGVLFWLAALSKLLNLALGFSLEQSSLGILYQPLPDDQRVRARTMAEGIVQPLAIGLAGILLLLFNTLLGFHAVELSYLFLVIATAWIVVTIALVREYPTVLSQALAKRRLGTATLDLSDAASVAVLEQGVRSRHPAEVLYSVHLLEQIAHPSLATVLPALLEHPVPEVRQDALQQIERLGMVSALPAVSQSVMTEPLPHVREAAVRTLAALGEGEVIEQVLTYLDAPDMEVRRGAMVGLLRSGRSAGMPAARERLLRLCGSPDTAERAMVAHVLGDVGRHDLYQLLWSLLHDHDPQVRRAALLATGNLKHPKLWPVVVEALAIPGLRAPAAQALVAGGQAALPELRAAFTRGGQPRDVLIRLARVCGRIGGKDAVALLRDTIDVHDPGLRTEILRALSACGYHASGAATARVLQQIKAEASQAVWLLATQVDIGDDEQVALLTAALSHQFQQTRERIFFLLSLLYDAQTILQARDALMDRSGAQRAVALEVIDTRLTQELKSYLLPLLDDLTPGQRLQRLSATFPQARLSREQRIQKLIMGTETKEEPWTRACAIYTVGHLVIESCRAPVADVPDASEPLVREMARWTLARFDALTHAGPEERKGGQTMLSTIEKVMILRTVGIFAATPGNVLADVAVILEEIELNAGEMLFQKGDLGNSMYIIVSGKVRVHDGEHTLDELGERQVVGELALLDPEPRVASVAAIEDTRLFRLLREPFYELMADRPEVARGIIHVLTGYVRRRVRDVADLHGRVQALERAASGSEQPRYSGSTA